MTHWRAALSLFSVKVDGDDGAHEVRAGAAGETLWRSAF